jgi:hypothetical protein
MRKTDKKIDNQLRIALTEVCEVALEDIDGFQWLTHLVQYTNFPQSLQIVCVFDTNQQFTSFNVSATKQQLSQLIQKKLLQINIKFKNIDEHIRFDTEQNCESEHQGKWAERLA